MTTCCASHAALSTTQPPHKALVRSASAFTPSEALVSEIDRQFAPVASARQINWECHTTQSESSLITDASRCQQIFGNLASNALKYTPPGGRVRIFGRALSDSWQVTFADSGPGIPVDSHHRVFEPFVRLPRDERAGIEGSGLGLAICHELVTQLEGKITLESGGAAGTSITVRFPIGAPAETTTDSPQGVQQRASRGVSGSGWWNRRSCRRSAASRSATARRSACPGRRPTPGSTASLSTWGDR